MSNSTRSGGYDERLVVPLEASRRGAHRARLNPFLGALPLLAVVVVVAAVIGVAYQLFLKPSTSTGTGSPPVTASSAPATTSPAAPAPSPNSAGGSSSSSTTSASTSATTGTVDKTATFTVYNGSTAQTHGLGRRAAAALQAAGWTAGQVHTSGLPVALSRTTRVYYAKSSQRATAEALQKALGVGTVKLSPSVAANGIVVVVGDDYHG